MNKEKAVQIGRFFYALNRMHKGCTKDALAGLYEALVRV